MTTETLKIATISMHSSPLGDLGTRDTGGMSVYIREVVQRLGAMGYGIDIFTRLPHSAGLQTIHPFENVRIIHLPAGPQEPLHPLELYRHLPEFFENLEQFRQRERIRYHLVQSHHWLSGRIGQWAHRSWQVPHSFMFHTLGALKNAAAASQMEPELRITVEKLLAAEADCIIAGTEREKRQIIELFGTLPEKIRVIPCGVDFERFRPIEQAKSRERLGLNEAERVILYVGRFDPIKGVDRLLEATSRLRREIRLRVVLVGGGNEDTLESQALRATCSQLGLNGLVTFAGRKAHGELVHYYNAADVLVLPSYYESFGLVVLEALACGTPVVATRVGAVEDTLQNGVNGWVVSNNDSASLADGVRRALELKTVRGASPHAIRRTIEGYAWQSIAAAIDREYRLMLAGDAIIESARAAACCSS